jgi:hypothetical protein
MGLNQEQWWMQHISLSRMADLMGFQRDSTDQFI